MKTKFLLPAKFKIWGWILFIIGSCLGAYSIFYGIPSPNSLNVTVLELSISLNPTAEKIFRASFGRNNIFDETLSILIIIGGLLVSFSREKDEDELTSKIRQESLIWAILLNYSILLLAIIFIYDLSFLTVMIFSMFTPLVFFIIRFNWILWKSRKSVKHEE